MAPRKKKAAAAQVPKGASSPGPGICGLPTELFDEICVYLRSVDVLNLGCANKRLASLTTSDSRIWTVLYQSMGYPPIPDAASLLITTKSLLTVASRVGCAYCPTKSKQVNWRTIQRVCSKCISKVKYAPSVIPGEEFDLWAERMRKAGSMSEADRRAHLAGIRAQRRRDIISRFAAINPAITESILVECNAFERASEIATPLTDRIFSNLVRSAAYDIKANRVSKAQKEWYLQLHAEAMDGVPEVWSNYMNGHTLICNCSTRFSDDERMYYARFQRLILVFLKDYAWNESFPAFNSTPYLEDIRKIVRAPYERFMKAENDLLTRFPHLEPTLATLKGSVSFMSSIVTKFQSKTVSGTDYEEFVERTVRRDRLNAIMPDATIIFTPEFKIHELGATEWFKRNTHFFDYKLPGWDQEATKQSWDEWMRTMTARQASLFRHIVTKCNPELLRNEPDRFYGGLNEEMILYENSPQQLLLADLDIRAVCIVREDLSGIWLPSYLPRSYRFRNASDLALQAVKEIAAAPDEYDETKLFEACSGFFNQACLMGACNDDVVEEKYFSSIGKDFTTGFYDFSDAEMQNWKLTVRQRVMAVFEEMDPVHKQRARFQCHTLISKEIRGEGDAKNFENARCLLEYLLPTNAEFNAKEAIKKFGSYLNQVVDDYFPNYDSDDGSGYESDEPGPGCSVM
ncbi:hypothetical protein HDU79_006046 [Rhizoclosmatium sp. JEL0117]|nr:hypothetical protein HDU79_006046 [Rhizoclosmatium sp. JEL0117]